MLFVYLSIWLLSASQQDTYIHTLVQYRCIKKYSHASFAHKKKKKCSKMQNKAFQSLLRNYFQMTGQLFSMNLGRLVLAHSA